MVICLLFCYTRYIIDILYLFKIASDFSESKFTLLEPVEIPLGFFHKS